MPEQIAGHDRGPEPARLVARATTRESWRLVSAYMDQEYPTAHDWEARAAFAAGAQGRLGRVLRVFRRRVAAREIPRPLGRARPAD